LTSSAYFRYNTALKEGADNMNLKMRLIIAGVAILAIVGWMKMRLIIAGVAILAIVGWMKVFQLQNRYKPVEAMSISLNDWVKIVTHDKNKTINFQGTAFGNLDMKDPQNLEILKMMSECTKVVKALNEK
jgi:hypothetical protein